MGNDIRSHLSEHGWLHFTQMKNLDPRIYVSGGGCILTDIEGRDYIDGLAGTACVNVGYGRRELIDAMVEAANTFQYCSPFGNANLPAILLAERLAHLAPGDLCRAFFVNDGSEAVEASIKMARQYHYATGTRGRYKVIARKRAYHGTTLGALSAMGIPEKRLPFEPLLQGFFHIPAPHCYQCEYGLTKPACNLECARELTRTIEFQGPETVAAVIMEPVIGAGGLIPPPDGYLASVRETCDRFGVLLIFDEVMNGFGRTGTMFACENWGVVPDILAVSKGLTSGYLPAGAAVARPRIADAFLGERERCFWHGHTFGGHPVVASVAMANLNLIEKEDLVARSRESGEYFIQSIRDLTCLPIVGEVRGIGLTIAIEVNKELHTQEKSRLGKLVQDTAYARGFICRYESECIQIFPPLVISKAEIDRAAEILHVSFAAAQEQSRM